MKHIPLKITFELANSEVLITKTPFDGILARLEFDSQKEQNKFNGDYSQRLKFLTFSDGIYHASNPIFNVNFIDNEFISKNFDNKLYKEIGKKPDVPALYEKGSGRLKAWLVSFEKISTDKVIYYVNGDFEKIAELLANLRYLGKKASIGVGKIKSITIDEIENDLSLVQDNKAMRHLPNIPKYQNLKNIGKVLLPLTHPYWKKGNDEICLCDKGDVK